MGLLYEFFGIKPTEMWEFYDFVERRSAVVSLEIYKGNMSQMSRLNSRFFSDSEYDIYKAYHATALDGKKITFKGRLIPEQFGTPTKLARRLILDEIESARTRFGNLEIKIDPEIKDNLGYDLNNALQDLGCVLP